MEWSGPAEHHRAERSEVPGRGQIMIVHDKAFGFYSKCSLIF